MMYAIVTDTHAGVRADATNFADYQDYFWEHVFFPSLKSRGITNILHLGDFFDKRQYISIKTMERVKKTFCRLLKEYDCTLHLIVGNHDVLYRNTNEANSPDNIFHGYSEVNVITEPLLFDNILMVPWINKENYATTLDTISKTEAKYCFGHFEISGFEMHRGQVCESGMSQTIFDRFALALSGHFHTRSSKGNITYLGSPFELTWADYNDPKGFHFFDSDAGTLEFVQHNESMFFRVEYDRENDTRMWLPYKPESVASKFVKIVVVNKGSAYEFDKWVKELTSYNPADIQIIESQVDVTGVELSVDELEQQAMSNLEIIRNYVDNLNAENKKKEVLYNYLKTIYAEAEAV